MEGRTSSMCVRTFAWEKELRVSKTERRMIIPGEKNLMPLPHTSKSTLPFEYNYSILPLSKVYGPFTVQSIGFLSTCGCQRPWILLTFLFWLELIDYYIVTAWVYISVVLMNFNRYRTYNACPFPYATFYHRTRALVLLNSMALPDSIPTPIILTEDIHSLYSQTWRRYKPQSIGSVLQLSHNSLSPPFIHIRSTMTTCFPTCQVNV